MSDLRNLTDDQLDQLVDRHYEEICQDFAQVAKSDALLRILDEIERRLALAKHERLRA